MDFGQIDIAERAVMHVRDINGRPAYQEDGSPITITLLSDDAEVLQRQARAAINRRLSNPSKMRVRVEDLEEEALDKLAVATVAWSGIKRNGEPVACDFQEVRKLYAEHRWLREQVDSFVGERANFLTSSQSS
jgi:hypothetical protein